MACKDKEKAKPQATGFDARCEQLGKACGDKVKHIDKIADDCKAAAAKLTEKGCTEKAVAVYDCYEKEVCGKDDKVWALDDLRVLADRKGKCATERTAFRECVGK